MNEDILNNTKQRAPIICQVHGCLEQLLNYASHFQRYRCCPTHARAVAVAFGDKEMRFCQRCGKFQPLEDFDDTKRSCRERLKAYNQQRKMKRHALAEQKSAGRRARKSGKKASNSLKTPSDNANNIGVDDEVGVQKQSVSMEMQEGEPDGSMQSLDGGQGNPFSLATSPSSAGAGVLSDCSNPFSPRGQQYAPTSVGALAASPPSSTLSPSFGGGATSVREPSIPASMIPQVDLADLILSGSLFTSNRDESELMQASYRLYNLPLQDLPPDLYEALYAEFLRSSAGHKVEDNHKRKPPSK